MKLFLILFVSILTTYLSPPNVYAANQLYNVRDVVNSNVLEESTEHTISFVLPFDSEPLLRTDYIQVYLADFTDVTAGNVVVGDHAGTPIFSVSGNYSRVTGIRLDPGGYLEIQGITATSPPSEDQFQVIVMITRDEAGTQVKNIANTIATVNRGSVSVQASIPQELASLIIAGDTAPLTYLIFSENESVIGTDTSNNVGGFQKAFSGLTPATHSITFYGIDTQSRTTSPIPLSIYLPAYQQTLISNLLLSPTIDLDDSTYLQTDTLTASGSAIPNGAITVFTDAPVRSYATAADANGDWGYTITNTSEYAPGDYRAYAIVQNQYGSQSLISPSVFFTIRTTDATGTACGDISQGDLNCDGNVDLIDFSILMYYYGTPNASADVNGSGLVDLTDFSILMYYWGT